MSEIQHPVSTHSHGIRDFLRSARNAIHWLLIKLAPLYALGAALARCWPVLLMMVLGPATLALLPQGRQALYVAGQSANAELLALYMYGIALLAIGIYPMILLDTVRSRTGATRAWLYAKYTVPQLIAATAGYALPLLLRYATPIELDYGKPGGEANAAVGGIGVLLEIAAVAAACVPAGLMAQNAKRAQEAPVIASLFVVCIAWAIPFIFFDPGWMFTRYLFLIGGIVAANAIFSGAYEFAHARRKLLKNLAAVLLIYSVIALWIAVRIAVAPGERAPWWGPFSVVLIAMLGWLSIAYIIDWILWRLAWRAVFRVHRAALGVLRFAVFGFIAFRLATGAFGNTAVHTLPVAADAPQTTLAAYLDGWLKERMPKQGARPYPVFIVTAEGGGIRAAYWTANVLAALHDANPQFANHVLALSGVSGGSVGTSVYAALAAGGDTTPACKQEQHVQACAQAIGGADLLSAPLAAMLLSEPFNRITARIPGADRAAALDHALEHAWLTTMGDDRFAAPFGDVAARRMLVLPNATSAGSAQRIVITPLAAEKEFANAQTLDGRAFSFSTATLLSARFPGLSPAGVYTPAKGEPMRIVDGGYTDNSGTATGAEVLSALTAAIDRAKARGRFKPVVIAISNGSEIVEKSSVGGLRTTTLGLALDAVATLESVRVSTSKRYEAALRTQVTAQKGEYLSVRLLHRNDEFPLGWMLAPATTNAMNGRLKALGQDEKSEFSRAGALLR